MPEATKIISFPSRAKPRALPSKSRIAEFAQLSEIIGDQRSGNATQHVVSMASTTEGTVPNAPTWSPGAGD